MNQNQIQQLTLNLSQALDQNYDVVNMEAVLSVISALEGTTITKDQLEATRLAKYINQLRRRTKNEQLARRAKSLLKKWREMVGIQQTNDSQQQIQVPAQAQAQSMAHSSQKPMISESQSNISDNDTLTINAPSTQPAPTTTTSTHRVIADLHSNINSSEAHQTNFANLITQHMNIDNIEESMVKHPHHPQRSMEPQRSVAFINEHSSNSVSHQLNQASIVIVSDSDENDSVQQKLATSNSSSIAIPAHYPRPKKIKKDKKRKERAPQHSLFNSQLKKSADFNCFPIKDGKAPINYPTDSEILSLSNSSMSSLFSGDALSANSQHKHRTTTTTTMPTTSDLTFAGRFKSVSQLDTSSHDSTNSTALANGLKTVCRSNEATNVDQPIRQIYDEYINNESSTSCSRLSPFEELEAKQSQSQSQIHSKSFVEPNRHQIPTLLPSKPHDAHSAEYHENLLGSQIPKKRGRKKGSKGVDSVIAESRLSQQILFGSGVKKVKTTKELFNEIQGRKLSISFNRADVLPASNNLSNANTLRNRDSRSAITRPTSSCSETSMHSPQTLEAYSANISSSGIESKFSNIHEDTGNTDSDTITSEPSRDSIKSGEIKRSASLDSISNSMQTSSVKNAILKSTAMNNHNDVTTQLMHLVNSLSSPLSVDDTEKLYQAQIVPCTCIIVEETQNLSTGQADSVGELDDQPGDLNKIKSNDENDNGSLRDNTKKNEEMSHKVDSSIVKETTVLVPQKPKKSIFDLDFDDDEDPLQSIIEKNISPAEANSNLQRPLNNDNENSHDLKSIEANEANNVDMQAAENQDPDQENDADKVPEIVSIYTVHEDPNCVAKQRFTVQTNNVTNFHINALHNYYVPNINGNWNSIESTPEVLKTTISEFLKELDAYVVSDGADVAPKYGSLTYDRIPKELSFRKFAINIEKKFLKSHIPPFLGVAKCLPSCRLASKRARNELKQLELIEKLQIKSESNLEPIKDSPSPLRVEVYTHDGNDNTNDNENGNQRQMQFADGAGNLLKLANNGATTWPDDGNDGNNSSSSSSGTCSNSSLKTTQNSINAKLRSQRAHTTNTEHIEQNVVERNRKKRRKATKLTAIDSDNDKKPRIKRMKIAINGNYVTQRQISNVSSSSDDETTNKNPTSELSDTEDEEIENENENERESIRSHSTTIDSIGAEEEAHLENDNEYDNDNDNENDNYNNSNDDEDEEYAIVQKPTLGGSKNHIVLTIKKTPSKINSPVNSISAISPSPISIPISNPIVAPSSCVVDVDAETAIETAKYINLNNNNNSTVSEMITAYQQHPTYNSLSLQPKTNDVNDDDDHVEDKDATMSHTCLNSNFHRCYRYRCRRYGYRRRLKHQSCPKETIDIELKHLFNNNNNKNNKTTQAKAKTHRKLFFMNELNREDIRGRKERIINYSSSSSNYDDDESEEEQEQEQLSLSSNGKIDYKFKVETETSASPSVRNITADPYLSTSDDESIKDEVQYDNDNDDNRDYDGTKFNVLTLDNRNNGMLPSFNSINAEQHLLNQNVNPIQAATLESLQIENCDDVNSSICYNNNNLSLNKSHSLDSNTPINNNNNDNDNVDVDDKLQASKVIANNSSNVLENNDNVHVEYKTGIRTIAEDDPDPGTSRIQKFKEWHEVLHLQSYNNEPLIVLPYVVLE